MISVYVRRQHGGLELDGIIALLVLVAILAWTGIVWHYATTTTAARMQKTIDKQEADIAARDKKIQDQAQEQLIAQVAAFDKGTAQAQELAKKISTQGQHYVQANPAFANAKCDIGPDFVQLINYASTNMRTAAAAGFSDATLPAPATDSGRQDGDGGTSAPGGSEPRGSVGAVHPKPRPTHSAH